MRVAACARLRQDYLAGRNKRNEKACRGKSAAKPAFTPEQSAKIHQFLKQAEQDSTRKAVSGASDCSPAVSACEYRVLQLLSLAYEPVTSAMLLQVLNACGIRNTGGQGFTDRALSNLLAALANKGFVEKVKGSAFRIDLRIAEPLSRELVAVTAHCRSEIPSAVESLQLFRPVSLQKCRSGDALYPSGAVHQRCGGVSETPCARSALLRQELRLSGRNAPRHILEPLRSGMAGRSAAADS